MVNNKSVIDTVLASQVAEAKEQNEYADLVALPAGRRMLAWMQLITSTWWFKVFSRFDKRFRKGKK